MPPVGELHHHQQAQICTGALVVLSFYSADDQPQTGAPFRASVQAGRGFQGHCSTSSRRRCARGHRLCLDAIVLTSGHKMWQH